MNNKDEEIPESIKTNLELSSISYYTMKDDKHVQGDIENEGYTAFNDNDVEISSEIKRESLEQKNYDSKIKNGKKLFSIFFIKRLTLVKIAITIMYMSIFAN